MILLRCGRRSRPATRVILLCTPNNPTGPALPHDAVIDFLDAVPEDVMVVLDEAYVEFVTDPSAVRGLEALRDRPNVVVLRTFSKAYGLAGFRVGYGVAEPDLAGAVRAVSLPFGVSRVPLRPRWSRRWPPRTSCWSGWRSW